MDQAPKKKTVLVVKSLRDLSPKKTVLVSHKAHLRQDEPEDYEGGEAVGNASPQKVEKKDGSYVTRSMLGDPAAFDELERRGRVSSPVKGQSKRKARPVVKKAEAVTETAEAAAEAPHLRILKDKNLYISTVQSQQVKSESVRARDEKRQTMLMSYLPVNEKFDMNKEGQVLSRWQERQRDWVSIEEGIARRINASRTHTLMMSKTFDFRIKREEYDLIQAAIPAEVKFGTSVWERSLRNGNTRIVSVGHVFTGLECEIDGAVMPPVLIRKPRLAMSNVPASKAFDVTEHLARTRRRWKHNIETIRPRDIEQTDVDGLQINCQPLFEWAIDSAREYFDNNLGQQDGWGDSMMGSPYGNVNATARSADDGFGGSVPTLELVSSPEVVFTVNSNKTTRRLVTFQNTGTVAIEYDWRPEAHCDNVEKAYRDGAYFGSNISQILDEKLRVAIEGPTPTTTAGTTTDQSPTHTAMPRTSAYVHTKSVCFFCSQPKGIVLPGETMSVLFGFNSTNIPASVSQVWKMHTVPRTKFSHRVTTVAYTQPSPPTNLVSYAPGSAPPTSPLQKVAHTTIDSKPVDMMLLHLHGVVEALEMDETTDKRNKMATFLHQQTVNCINEDEYNWCLRRVRLPVRTNDLNSRIVAAFIHINESLLTNLSENYGSCAQLCVTPSRLQDLVVLCLRVTDFNISVAMRLNECRLKRLALWNNASDAELEALPATAQAFAASEEVDSIRQRHCQAANLATVRNQVFPEQLIEIFDEVTEEQIQPRWDMNVLELITSLQESADASMEIQTLEAQIAKMEAANDKARIKEAKRLQRLALRKPGDDDDEEEEEDEDEEEAADDSVPIPVHPLTAAALALLGDCRGSLIAMFTRQTTSEEADVALNTYAQTRTRSNIRASSLSAEAGGSSETPKEECHPHKVTVFPTDAVSDVIATALSSLGDWIGQAKEAVGLDPHVPIPPTHAYASPFVTAEGAKAWKALLAPEPEPDVGNNKKGGKPKAAAGGGGGGAKKGKGDKAAPITPELAAEFYGKVHEMVKGQLLDMVERVFEVVDTRLEQQARERVNAFTPTFAAGAMTANVHQVSCLSFNKQLVQNRIVLQTFDGAAFVPSTMVVSAYPLQKQQQRAAMEPVLTAAQNGAAAIVLLYESIARPTPESPTSFAVAAQAAVRKTLMECEGELYELDQSRKRKKSYDKSKARLKVDFNVQICRNFADLAAGLQTIAAGLPSARDRDRDRDGRSPSKGMVEGFSSSSSSGGRVVPVLLMEDLSNVGLIVPPAPALPELVEEDIEAPIDIGLDEYLSYRADKWTTAPHRAFVPVGLNTAGTSSSSSNAASNNNSSLRLNSNQTVHCLTDPLAAFNELLSVYGSRCVWVDGCTTALCPPQNHPSGTRGTLLCQAEVEKYVPHLCVSEEMQQTLAWCSVLQQLPEAQWHLSTALQASPSDDVTSTNLQLSKFMASLCPRSIGAGNTITSSPKLLVCVGGFATADKFRVLDELLDLAPTVYVGGELAIPFLALSGRVQFTQYRQLVSDFRQACVAIVRKARMRGVALKLPVDILAGDEQISSQLRRKCFDKFDPDSRDEGADYGGEIKSVVVSFPADSTASDEAVLTGPLFDAATGHAVPTFVAPSVKVDGFVYDIGEQSRKVLQDLLAKEADILVSWGPLGACEVSGFQMGQRTLVQGSLLAAWPEGAIAPPPAATITGRPLHTWIIGDSNAEWFSRYADADGELAGDLVEAGRAAHVSRCSRLAVGVLGGHRLKCVARLSKVVETSEGTTTGAWRMNMKKTLYPEEEDEEEEEEEDE